MKKKMVRIGAISREVGVSHHVIDRLIRHHRIPCVRLDARGNRFFDLDKVNEALGLSDEKTTMEDTCNGK